MQTSIPPLFQSGGIMRFTATVDHQKIEYNAFHYNCRSPQDRVYFFSWLCARCSDKSFSVLKLSRTCRFLLRL